jgi:hypothetical protein
MNEKEWIELKSRVDELEKEVALLKSEKAKVTKGKWGEEKPQSIREKTPKTSIDWEHAIGRGEKCG